MDKPTWRAPSRALRMRKCEDAEYATCNGQRRPAQFQQAKRIVDRQAHNCWPLRLIARHRSTALVYVIRVRDSTLVLTVGREQWNNGWKHSSRKGVVIVAMLEQDIKRPAFISRCRSDLDMLLEWSSLVLQYRRGFMLPMN